MTPALSPGRLAAPGATRLGRSVLSQCPDAAVGARNDDPRRRQHGGTSLDHALSGVWDGLTSHNTVACPVCRGPMVPRYGSGAVPVGGRCRRCGSSLG
jgi:hypothetical protein